MEKNRTKFSGCLWRYRNRNLIPISKNGSILILSLWVLTLLGLVAVAVSHQAMLEYKLAGYAIQESQTRRDAESSVWKAWAVVNNDTNGYDFLEELWALPVEQTGEGLMDEDRKVYVMTHAGLVQNASLVDRVAPGLSAQINAWMLKNQWDHIANEVELQMALGGQNNLLFTAYDTHGVNINTADSQIVYAIIENETTSAGGSHCLVSVITASYDTYKSTGQPYSDLDTQWLNQVDTSSCPAGDGAIYSSVLKTNLHQRFKANSDHYRLERELTSSKVPTRLSVIFKKGNTRPDIQFWYEEKI